MRKMPSFTRPDISDINTKWIKHRRAKIPLSEVGVRNIPRIVAAPQHKRFGQSQRGIFHLDISVGSPKGAQRFGYGIFHGRMLQYDLGTHTAEYSI